MRKSLLIIGLVIIVLGAILISVSQYTPGKEELVYTRNFSSGSPMSFSYTFKANTIYRLELTGQTGDANLLNQKIYLRVHTSTIGILDLGYVQTERGPYSWTYASRPQQLTGTVILEDNGNLPIAVGYTGLGGGIATVDINVYEITPVQAYGYLFYVGISLVLIGAGVMVVGVLYPSRSTSNPIKPVNYPPPPPP